jgi:phosphoribosylanthranilate isomerase
VAVKFCGATTAREIDTLADAGVDLVGLWHGVAGGKANLSLPALAALVRVARANPPLVPVLVTFLGEADTLRDVVDGTNVDFVQLHGYQPPSLIRALKRARDVTVIKVLHVRAGECAEQALIPAYERAGTDFFLFDAATADGRIGSTGHQLDTDVVLRLVARMSRPFMLAGGISWDNRAAFDRIAAHARFCGVDVDTAARDHGGQLNQQRIEAIARAWRITCEQGAPV